MKKTTLIFLLCIVLLLPGCKQIDKRDQITPPPSTFESKENITDSHTNQADENVSKEFQGSDIMTQKKPGIERKYKLVATEDYSPVYLTLKPDLSFDMDFNYCQGISHGTGHYSSENNLYFLNVENSSDMPSLSTVKLELKVISDTELQVVSEVYRTENKEKIYFCTPFSDPDKKLEGIEYNIYQLIN